jgi:DNA-binding SARP family transcriptional activator
MQKHISPAEVKKKSAPLDPLRSGESAKRTGSRPIARIHLIGSMRATSYLGADILPRGRKARAVLGCLCLADGARIPRSRLAATLWDRVPDFQGRASFRQAFRELMVAFGPLADELISSDRETIRLNTNLCWIDALAVLAPEPQSARRSDLASHFTGELMEELDDVTPSFGQWLLSERTRFNEKLRALLEAELKHVHRSSPDANERAEIARRLIAYDPTHEGASRILMRALADMGERAQALREYGRCRDALKATLDVEPSPETHALYEAIRSFSAREERDPQAATPAPAKKKTAKPQAPAPQRTRLRVGVLPLFAAPSSHDEMIAFSLSQEIAAALARFRWFDVIAPVALKRRETIVSAMEEHSRPSELDFVVDGAISGNGGKFQISVRLLDLTRYATSVWSDRFELAADELHRIDELVTAKIVSRIDPVILFIEGQPRRREKYGALGLLMRAMPMVYSMERKKFEEAGELINRALELDPDDAMALAWAAYWHMWHVGQGWTTDPVRTLGIAEKLCLNAMKIDPENAEALGIYAHTLAWKKEFDNARHFFDRSLRLNPNLAYIWALSAATYAYVGQPEIALRQLERYRELAPFDPYYCFFESIYALTYMIQRDYDQVLAFSRRVVKANPDFTAGYKPLIAALGHLDRAEEAKPYLEKLLTLEPAFTIAQYREVYPLMRDTDRDHYMEGLRLAGVPER